MDEILKALAALDKAIENGPKDKESLESIRQNLLLRMYAIKDKQYQPQLWVA